MTFVQTDQKTVLLVQHDAWTRAVLLALLAGEGFAVLEAETGEAAIRLAEARRPHAVLLDLALPSLSGLEVLRQLKRSPTTAEIPVVVLSTYNGLARRQHLPQAQAIVEAPLDFDALVNHVERLTGRLAAETHALRASALASRPAAGVQLAWSGGV